MGKMVVLGLAVGACLWAAHMYFPEIAHTAFIIPRVGMPVSFSLLIGVALFAGFHKLVKK